MSVDPALRFWLDWAESGGAACERGLDTSLVLLPSAAAGRLGLAEEVAVTSEPEVARDEGALLLTAGHPVVHRAADEVLALGDVGRVELARPRGAPPSGSDLLARARDGISVDHGRLDLAGEPRPRVFPMLRVGVLVTYHVSQQDSYQERAEQWIDVESGTLLSAGISERLARAERSLGTSTRLPDGVERAYSIVHAQLVRQAEHRSGELAAASDQERSATVARTGAYYDAVLEGLESRMRKAPPERQATYASRIEATKAERVRRLAEVEEGFRPRCDVRPYRLHLVGVPGVALPTEVQRGARRYPFALSWLLPVAEFLARPCPACGSGAVLVATKKALGCRECITPTPEDAVVPAPRVPAAAPAKSPQAKPAPVARAPVKPAPSAVTRAPGRRGSAPRTRDPARLPELCDKASMDFWQSAVRGDRKHRRVMAPGSPIDALRLLYGPAAAFVAIGLSPWDQVETGNAGTYGVGGFFFSSGSLSTSGGERPFTMQWSCPDGVPVLHEILPAGNARLFWMLRLRRMRGSARSELFAPAFDLAVDPEPVSRRLLDVVLPREGVALVARCLAVRNSVADQALEQDPAMFVAALRYEVARLSDEKPRYADIAYDYRVDEGALRAAVVRLRPQVVVSW